MKISFGSWAFSFGPYADQPVPFAATVERLSATGYDGVEISGFPPHITLEDYSTAASRRELLRFVEDRYLGISGYTADFTRVNPVAAQNRQRYLDLFRRNLEMCVDLESPALRVDTIAAPGSLDDREYEACFNRLADLWRECAQIAQEGGVRMVWEFEPGFVFNKPSEIVELHRRVAHRNFRVLFDTCHAYMCAVEGARQRAPRETLPGGVLELLRKLEGRIGAVHMIDSDGSLYGDETSAHIPFGEGKVNFRALAPHLRKLSGIDWWCIDMCFRPDSWDLLESSRKFVAHLSA